MAAIGLEARSASKRRPARPARVVLAVLLALLLVSWSSGQQAPPRASPLDPALAEKLGRRGDLTLNDAPLAESLLRVTEIWGVNLIAGEKMEGRVTGVFTNAPLHEILDAILLSNGYTYRPVGSSLVILKLADAGNASAMFETATLQLRYTEPKDCVESLKMLGSPRGKIQAIDSARVVLVSDFPEQVAAMRRFVEELDAAAAKSRGPGRTGTGPEVVQFKLQYAQADKIKESVQAVLSQSGKLGVIAVENRIVIADLPANLELAGKVISQLDVPRTQVRITALIYDVSLKDMETLGINWKNLGKMAHDAAGEPSTSLAFDSITTAAVPAGDPSGVLTFMNLSKHIDITAVVQALQTCSDSRLLANPNLTVLENEAATISSITEIPYQQLTQTAAGGNIGTTAFREAGVKLEVTPMISADGTIQMLVTPTFSRLTGYTPGEQPQPIIDKREAKTTVRVANGQTFVIGGLRQRSDIGEYSGVPYLKDIKWIGHLFRSKQTTLRESELLVFIRPEIVTFVNPGLPREAAAAQAADALLDQIAPAQIPCDPGVRHLPSPAEEYNAVGQRVTPTQSSWVMDPKPDRVPYDERYRGGPLYRPATRPAQYR